jgi:hypothetical protein
MGRWSNGIAHSFGPGTFKAAAVPPNSDENGWIRMEHTAFAVSVSISARPTNTDRLQARCGATRSPAGGGAWPHSGHRWPSGRPRS